MKKDQEKTYTTQEVIAAIYKSMYKSILNDLRSKKAASKIVRDIQDPNYIAQVDPNEVPPKKDKVLYKTKSKGVNKLKKFLKKKVKKGEPIVGLTQEKN